MADTKLEGLDALAAGGQAAGDLIELVDVSDTTMAATGTNKKMTMTAFLGGLPADLLFTQDNPEILGGDTDGVFIIGAGATNILGGSIRLYGDTHASKAQDIEFYADATLVGNWNESAGTWDFNNIDGTIIGATTVADGSFAAVVGTTGAFSGTLAAGVTTITGNLNISAGSISQDNADGGGSIGQTITTYRASAFGAAHKFQHARGTKSTPTVVLDNDILGQIAGHGHDGTDFGTVVTRILFEVDDASPAGSDIGGLLRLQTASGTGSDNITDRFVIDAAGLSAITGTLKVSSLAGSGSRAVVVDANGLMTAP